MTPANQFAPTKVRYFIEVAGAASLSVALVFVCVQITRPAAIKGQALEMYSTSLIQSRTAV